MALLRTPPFETFIFVVSVLTIYFSFLLLVNYLDGHRIFVFIPSQNLNEMFCISDAFSETSF